MRHIRRCAVVLLFAMSIVESPAQFYTVKKVGPAADTLSISADPYACNVLQKTKSGKETDGSLPLSAAKLRNKPSTSNIPQGKKQEKTEKTEAKEWAEAMKIPDLSLFSASDSLFMQLLKKGLTICYPLDYMHVTSPYGYRKDPFTRCSRFHDGIDLRGRHELVYSMLPGRVEQVGHGNKGYGNYVVLNHGSFRCLYGHLSETYARDGEMVSAGTVVGRVGSTGRSTGSHLHVRLERKDAEGRWRSVDPVPLITLLNREVEEFNTRLTALTGVGPHLYNKELTIANLYEALKQHGIKYPKIVLAQAILETGHFRSRVCRELNNLFGLRHSRGYYSFDNWEESVIAYRDKVQYRHREGEGYYAFLKRIGYSESPAYIYKVKEIAERL